MARNSARGGSSRQDDYDDRDDDDYAEAEGEAVAQSWIREMPFWAVSAGLHLILLLILMALGAIETTTKKEDVVPIVMKQQAPPPPPYDPTLERAMKKTPKILDPKNIEKPVIQRQVQEVVTDIPKGTSLDNLSDFNRNAHSINTAIGVGGGAAGAYGSRFGKGALIREGGSAGTESAVRAALEWLRRHQDEDGKWSAADYQKHCKDGKNKNEDFERYGEDKAFPEHDVGVTALAMLAFTGYGQTHLDGDHPEYVACLRKAVRWMKQRQQLTGDAQTDGRYGSGEHEQWIYDHAIATMAMAELYVMSNDISLKNSVKKAVQFCLRTQNDGFGWRYGVKPADNDTSVTGWMVLALKTAKNARGIGIQKSDFERAFGGALNWFDRATAANGKCGYLAAGDEGSRLAKGHPDPYPYSKELSCMTAVSVLCRLFGGESRDKESIRDGVKILMKEPPVWQEQSGLSLSKINLYYWYYGTYALFQFGGQDWKVWNESMQDALLKTQRQGNICEDGSWDPIDEWGIAGGRVYSTAIGAMTLEVFYRFERHAEGTGY
jgi:hypothetical protein